MPPSQCSSVGKDTLHGSKVYVIGGIGLEEALQSFGLVPVTEPDADVLAVAQGYGPDMPWKQVLAGAVLVAQGLPWVATNTDLTIPLPNGIGPGNGALVKTIGDVCSTLSSGRRQARAALVRRNP